MTDGEMKAVLFQMAQAITTLAETIMAQANREVASRENQHASIISRHLRDSMRMNHPMYFGSKVDEDPQEFLYKWKDNRALGDGLVTWEIFKKAFHDRFFPKEQREAKVEESRLRNSNRKAKRAKSFESGSSKSRLDVQDKPKFKKRGSNLKPQKGRNVDPPKERPFCGKCGNKHAGECLVKTNSLYGCGKGVHMVKACPNVRRQGKGNGQTQLGSPSSDAQKRNRFCALKAKGEKESSPDVVTGMIQVFSINVYALLDQGQG
ncbi:uncharacterized protein LOC107024983 [Solanum pennellii]|uniref:Uncharacterized protein LOC107024983 n=1 Tax=Solanum pennellii TaxID=28526 RepID=A0ABM1H793_SOLPN|nr:uncharacterized protein LOC107024983 [Solanum pennellii]